MPGKQHRDLEDYMAKKYSFKLTREYTGKTSFSETVRKNIAKDDSLMGAFEDFSMPRPDGWATIPVQDWEGMLFDEIIIALEVDISSLNKKTQQEKMDNYSTMWFILDSYEEFPLMVVSIDARGNISQLNLRDYWMDRNFPEYKTIEPIAAEYTLPIGHMDDECLKPLTLVLGDIFIDPSFAFVNLNNLVVGWK